jgi:hypothetical protein
MSTVRSSTQDWVDRLALFSELQNGWGETVEPAVAVSSLNVTESVLSFCSDFGFPEPVRVAAAGRGMVVSWQDAATMTTVSVQVEHDLDLPLSKICFTHWDLRTNLLESRVATDVDEVVSLLVEKLTERKIENMYRSSQQMQKKR